MYKLSFISTTVLIILSTLNAQSQENKILSEEQGIDIFGLISVDHPQLVGVTSSVFVGKLIEFEGRTSPKITFREYKGVTVDLGLGIGGINTGLYYFKYRDLKSSDSWDNGFKLGLNLLLNNKHSLVQKNSNLIGIRGSGIFGNSILSVGLSTPFTDAKIIPLIGYSYSFNHRLW